MEISIIIPVYNAAHFVREAVESALAQPQTAEVILIEDHSTDGSLAVCEELARRYAQVRLLRHPGGENRGAGPSRTLGIEASTAPFIAFLDADDFYLPGRFAHVEPIFDAHPDADGVYDAIGTHFETDAARERWFSWRDSTLTTVEQVIPPEGLFEALVNGGRGYFHGNGLCVRRHIFDRTGPFDALPLHQDTAMWIRMAAVARLYPGNLETPVAMRRFHESNRVDAQRSQEEKLHNRQRMWEAIWRWSLPRLNVDQQAMLFMQLRYSYPELLRRRYGGGRRFRLMNLRYLAGFVLRHPRLITSPYFPLSLRRTVM